MNNEPIIKIENISKSYVLSHRAAYDTIRDKITEFAKKPFEFLNKKRIKDTKETFWALKDINFTINKGERIGIIGKNGAGKSTLLKILSQITHPTTGRIELNGRVASLLEVGTGFHPELTGRENIFLNGAILGMKRSEIIKKFDEIVEFSEISNFLDTPVKRYSSGMFVRLAFSVAAHLEPEILIVDEVLAVGDAGFQKKCLGKMKSVSDQGRTVIFVSHNLSAIEALCNRAILLKDGKIIINDKTQTVINKYTYEYSKNINFREWNDKDTAPQNYAIKIRNISVIDNNNKLLKNLNTDTEFNIKIDYEVKENNSVNGMTLVFYDDQNNCILGSISNHEPNWYGKTMPTGIYSTTCNIPKNLLNNIKFHISLIIFSKNFSDAKQFDNLLNISISDGPSVRKDFYGDFSGYLRPKFKWITKKTSQ